MPIIIKDKLRKKKNWALLRYFILIFAISLLLINWNEVYWIFSFRAVSGVISDFFAKENTEILRAETEKATSNQTETKESAQVSYPKIASIEISKINVSAPIVFVKNSDKKTLTSALNRGLLFYPDSVLPGQDGQTIILGHSAPPNWPDIRYDSVFSRLVELTEGDEIFLNFDDKKYVYSVVKKIFLEKGEEIPKDLTYSENILLLISCWPPGKNLRRIAVVAE